ncbi:ferredoxin [Microbacterium thalassium]|uniref:Ferredoxin n=1 Tax=Microbacterium thalassium TaxID=362649 RepID=A0A7X0FN22_9MICO|nr:ferredoxin [Microbacterium thalassium]MBB6390503.1 ferredoxin [Microbacterium thalassium]GLK25614.1 ferredoxin [Microbacterium thalassium]
MTILRIDVDRNRCTGIGICESYAPDRFEVDDDGTLIVRGEDVSAAERDEIEQAVNGCPAAALRLVEVPA